MSKIVIIGMNNPESDDPAHALWTQPAGCTGHRLWRMATARTGISEEQWLAATDRRNLCIGEWDLRRAWAQADAWREELRSRTVLMLGVEVMLAMRESGIGTPGSEHLMYFHWREDVDWCLLPHPSGLNRVWNQHVHVVAAEMLLEDIIRQTGVVA